MGSGLWRAVALGVSVAAGTVGWADEVADYCRALPGIVAKYRATGLPWVAFDLTGPHPKAEDDAAPLLRRVLKMADWRVIHLPSDAAHQAERGDSVRAAKAVAPYRKALDLAVEASRKPRLDFRRDWDRGPELVLPEYAEMKNVARFLAVRADGEAKDGNAAGAAADILAMRRLGALTAQDSNLISKLVQLSADSMAMRSAQHCAAFLVHDGAGLAALDRALKVNVPTGSFARSLRGEAYLSVATCRTYAAKFGQLTPFSGEGPPGKYRPLNPKKLLRQGLPRSSAARANMALVLRVWVEAAPAMKLDDPIALGKKFDDIVADFEAHRSPEWELAAALFPVFGQAARSVVTDEANDLVTRALVEALIVQAKTGRMPERIEEIPGKWIDPFSGKALRVRSGNGEIRVYSVGPEGRDYGGVDRWEPHAAGTVGAGKGWNIVAAYPPVPQSRQFGWLNGPLL